MYTMTIMFPDMWSCAVLRGTCFSFCVGVVHGHTFLQFVWKKLVERISIWRSGKKFVRYAIYLTMPCDENLTYENAQDVTSREIGHIVCLRRHNRTFSDLSGELGNTCFPFSWRKGPRCRRSFTEIVVGWIRNFDFDLRLRRPKIRETITCKILSKKFLQCWSCSCKFDGLFARFCVLLEQTRRPWKVGRWTLWPDLFIIHSYKHTYRNDVNVWEAVLYANKAPDHPRPELPWLMGWWRCFYTYWSRRISFSSSWTFAI